MDLVEVVTPIPLPLTILRAYLGTYHYSKTQFETENYTKDINDDTSSSRAGIVHEFDRVKKIPTQPPKLPLETHPISTKWEEEFPSKYVSS